ncbi:MAG: ATP synthase F0 subunit B [Endomicrobium sp.]|jgi:F-type H+-transporting ATPase subunit b|nr:ATP synthase F0 subunit B [Endomicrobium sp.]
MEIVQKFGLETKLFLFQVVNFLFIAFVLKFFLYTPLKKIFDERKHKIAQSLQDAESAKLALANAKEEQIKILANARNSADRLTTSVKISIEEAQREASLKAKQCSQQIIQEAKDQAAVEFKNINKQIGKMSVDVSGKIISKVLSDLFTDDEKQKLMSRALEKIDEKIAN